MVMFSNLVGRKNLSLDRLATLSHVAEAGSIGAAAGHDPNRQSQYSRQIAELESFLEVDLLDRHSKPYRLTEKGLDLGRICRNYLSALDDFVASCRGRPARVVVGAGESHIQWLLIPAILPRLRKAIPGVQVVFRNLQTQAIIEGLQNGELDLGFVRRNAVPKGLKTAGNWRQGYRLFVPRKLRAKLKPPVGLDQLEGLPMAVLEGEGEFRKTVDALCREAGVRMDLGAECSSFTQVAVLVGRRECCAILPSFARSQLDEATIEEFAVKGFKGLERTLCLAWNPKRAGIRPVIERAAAVIAEQ